MMDCFGDEMLKPCFAEWMTESDGELPKPRAKRVCPSPLMASGDVIGRFCAWVFVLCSVKSYGRPQGADRSQLRQTNERRHRHLKAREAIIKGPGSWGRT